MRTGCKACRIALKTQTHIFQNNQWKTDLSSELDSPNTLVLAFGAPELRMRTDIWTGLRAAFPSSRILGCSTAGEIQGPQVFDRSIALAVTKFERTRIVRAGAEAGGFEASAQAGRRLAEQFELPGLKAILLFSDGQFVNGSELLRGMYEVLPASIKISGGLAADGIRFGPTWVLTENGPQNGRVCGVGFYGDYIDVRCGSQGGWDRFGIERTITRSAGSVLYELDGKPALRLYKDYLGPRAEQLPASALLFPLEMRRGSGFVLRTILQVNEADQSLIFAGDVPEGSIVRLTHANFDKIVGCAAMAAETASAQVDAGEDSLLITVSCVGRRLVLKDRTDEELEATLSAMPRGVRQIGFYSYGEIAPVAGGTVSDLHNQTMTVTMLHER